jgi:hypothetical protein
MEFLSGPGGGKRTRVQQCLQKADDAILVEFQAGDASLSDSRWFGQRCQGPAIDRTGLRSACRAGLQLLVKLGLTPPGMLLAAAP